MLAGRFKTVVTLQTKTVTQTAGGSVNAWSNTETFRAQKIPIREDMKAQYQQLGNIGVELELRMRDEHEFQPGEIRFLIDSKTYLPASNLADKGKVKSILLKAIEDVNDL